MEKKNSSRGRKKEFENREDLPLAILRIAARDFPEIFSSVSMDEIKYNTLKKVKSEEGCSSSSNNNSDDLLGSNLAEEINLVQRDKSNWELLVDAGALFTAYEEERKKKQLAREFKEKIKELNGSEVKFVIEKQLFKTDKNSNNARFSIPPGQIANNFLTESEKSSLDERVGIPVLVLDPSLREWNMCFRKWQMVRSFTYNLTNGWNQFATDNALKEGDILQLWSFRVASQLSFALVKP